MKLINGLSKWPDFFKKINYRLDNFLIQSIKGILGGLPYNRILTCSLIPIKVNFVNIIEELKTLSKIKMTTQEEVQYSVNSEEIQHLQFQNYIHTLDWLYHWNNA